jgi:hypothetical protein
LVADETLVPPNLRTTHGEVLGELVDESPGAAPVAESAVVIVLRIQERKVLQASLRLRLPARPWRRSLRDTRTLQVPALGNARLLFVEIVQFFFEPTFGQNVFQFAPGGFALLGVLRGARTRPTIHLVDESIEVLLLIALGDEVIIDIEVLVVSLHHDDS